MAEERNNENTPPAFTFGNEATPRTSQEFFEGPSCTSDCCTTTSDDFFEDLWNAFKCLSYSEDVTGHTHVTESGITSSPFMASGSSVNPAQPSTSRAGIEEASAIPDDIASISNEALRYQRNTQHMPTTDEICNVDGVTDNGSQHLGSVSGIDDARPSTSRAGIEEASASSEDGATNATGTGGMEEQGFCGVRASVQSSAKKSKHKCETCGKFFRRAAYLTAHYRTHTGERPYKCEICAKSFARRSILRDHERIHTGLKPHICQICTKPFKNTTHLKTHLKSHSNDRPFVCDICNRSFKHKSHLQRHRKGFHEGGTP
ncbi:zinc finger and BTB domain-containing protein 14-like [Dermacentor albipictus]|uniref:zinc finger and BTB domain-containing protein 14-like n=1 Tax=Dermacentor albipictus TaxID=60249 RepID=UPI0031FBA5DC